MQINLERLSFFLIGHWLDHLCVWLGKKKNSQHPFMPTVQQSTLPYLRCSLWPSKHQRKLDVWQTKDSVTPQSRTCPSISLTSALSTELYIQECQPAHSAFPTTRMLLCSCCSAWRLDRVQREGRKTMSKRAFSIGLQHGANQRTGALSKRHKPEQNRI